MYCINPHAFEESTGVYELSPEELCQKLMADDLYFRATGGGVTFGGGEALLHADAIAQFRRICPSEWKIYIETSLNVPADMLETALCTADGFIVDVKDLNPEIYYRYTGSHVCRVRANLEFLSKHFPPEKALIRLPLIPGYNAPQDVERSKNALCAMGFSKFDVFRYIIPES